MAFRKKLILLLFLFIFLVNFICFIRQRTHTVSGNSVNGENHPFTVVIDAGHGGFDSGKVGVDGTLEKNINLSVSKKLEALLLAADLKVVMTRTEDVSLAESTSAGKKRQDMLTRSAVMNDAAPDCIVSIHQNSYPSESVSGAQVFYHAGSESGKLLASLTQQELVNALTPKRPRVEKAEQSYYLLKKASAPIVIVECGFLSNREESKKLADDAYQQKLAWAIHLGILQYLNLTRENTPTVN